MRKICKTTPSRYWINQQRIAEIPDKTESDIYSDEYETGDENSFQSEENSFQSEENDIPQERINERLRERSTLRKTQNLNDYVMAAEDYINSSSNPETY